MEIFATCITAEFLVCFVFTCVPQPIVFARKLTATVVACVRFDCFVGVHVRNVFGFPDECLRTQIAFKWFGRSARMDPLVLFQVPFGCQRFIANGAFVCCSRFAMLFHVHFQTRFNIFLFAIWTFHRIPFEHMKALCVRQSNVTHQAILMHESLPTIRTAFGLDVVRFTMPCDFRLRMKYFATRTNEVFCLRPQFQVMPITMLDQIAEALETFHTQATLQWRFVVMDSHVLDHILSQNETLRAIRAPMLAYVQVPFQMNTEINPSLECAAARVALGWMCCHMNIICPNAVKLFFARFTDVVNAALNDRKQIFVFVLCSITRFRFQRCPVVAQQVVV